MKTSGKSVWLQKDPYRDEYVFATKKDDMVLYAVSFDLEKWTGFKLKPGEWRKVRIRIEKA